MLSGFLITSNLLSRGIHFRKFYLRRFFRLMPTAWAFLAALAAFKWITSAALISWAEIRGCFFFYRNFQGGDLIAGHFWSLSIEEQFYLVWPCLLLLLGIRRCRWIALIGAAAIAIYRYAFWSRYAQGMLYTHTEVRADALLVGCLLAMLIADYRDAVAVWSKRLAPVALMLLMLAIYRDHVLQPLWESASIAVLLAFTSLHNDKGMSSFFDSRPLVWLGALSYCIYVWQEPFTLAKGGAVFISELVLMPLIAIPFHYWVERPWRNFGRTISEGQHGVHQ